MSLLVKLVGKGYFPKELPPVFDSSSLGRAVESGEVRIPGKCEWTDLHRHSLSRAGGLRRLLGIPNPSHFLKTAELVDKNWSKVIGPHLEKARFGLTKPGLSSNGRAIIPDRESEVFFEKAKIRIGSRYILRMDVQNFYHSIYTHTIPWAIHGKEISKSRLRKRLPKNFGEKLDTLIQCAQAGQTMGIPVGTDVSYLIGEILMIAIEDEVHDKYRDIKCYRWMDDFEIGCDSMEEAEAVRSVVESAMSQYELYPNPRKTEIIKLPERIESRGIHELRNWNFRKNEIGLLHDVNSYFDCLAELVGSDPESSATAYGINRLQGVLWTPRAWQLAQMRLAAFCINEPHVLKNFAQLISGAKMIGMKVDKNILGKIINSVIVSSVDNKMDYNLTWALWMAIENRVKINKKNSLYLSRVNESCSVLMVLMAHREKILNGNPGRDRWKKAMSAPALLQESWLLSYEARGRGWMRTSGGGDHRLADKVFAEMARAKVTFLNLGAVTQPSKPMSGMLGESNWF